MTAIQVRPLGTTYSRSATTAPPPPPPPQNRSVPPLRAVRCLFGTPDPVETRRIFEEDTQANLRRFEARYQILEPLPQAEEAIAADLGVVAREPVSSAASGESGVQCAEVTVCEARDRVSSCLNDRVQVQSTGSQQACARSSPSDSVAEISSALGAVRHSPAALGVYSFRKKPYPPKKQSRTNDSNGRQNPSDTTNI